MNRARLADVLIDDVTWGCATRPRRGEWRQLIQELTEEGVFLAPPVSEIAALRAYVTVHKGGIAVALHDPTGRQLERLELPHQEIAPIIREYMDIVRQMTKVRGGRNSPQMEALDIAKRLTHDDAAETLLQHFRAVRPDHATARRLFTLMVILTHDTTRLGAALRS